MKGGDKDHHHHHHHLLSFHLPHLGKKEAAPPGEAAMPPKGCMAIRVGVEGEEKERFVVPLMYLNHPLFLSLLKEAEEEYGFEQKGAITIPCHVEYFRKIQGKIDRETGLGGSSRGGGGGGSSHHHHHHHHHHNVLAGCFGA